MPLCGSCESSKIPLGCKFLFLNALHRYQWKIAILFYLSFFLVFISWSCLVPLVYVILAGIRKVFSTFSPQTHFLVFNDGIYVKLNFFGGKRWKMSAEKQKRMMENGTGVLV